MVQDAKDGRRIEYIFVLVPLFGEIWGEKQPFCSVKLMWGLACLAMCAAEKKAPTINSELWHACAGPLVSLPPAGSLVVYFPQGHSEQVAASMQKDVDAHVPSYPNLPSKLICLLHNVTLHADPETDEVYAQMTLQPVTSDFSMQPPAQEIQARDLHDNIWTFRHIYRACICRASPTEFVVPFAKYQKALYGNQISLGMRFRMMFETEELGTRRYMGTITGISDLDPVRWKSSQWRNLQVGWDESAAGERRNRVSIWEIEPVAAPFFLCPPPFFGAKRPRQLDDESSEMENLLKRAMPWLGEEICIKDPQTQNTVMPGLSLVQWMNMNMQQNSSFANTAMQSEYLRSLSNPNMQNLGAADLSRQLCLQNQILQQNSIQFNSSKLPQQMQPINELPKATLPQNQTGMGIKQQEQPQEPNNLQRQQQSLNQLLPLSQTQTSLVQAQVLAQNQMQQQQPPSVTQNLQPAASQPLLMPLHHQQQQQQKLLQKQQQQQFLLQQQPLQQHQQNQQQMPMSDQQLQLQLLQKLQQQQQSLMSQPTVTLAQLPLIQEQQKLFLDIQQQLSNSHSLSQQQMMPQQSTKVPSLPTPTPTPAPMQQESPQKVSQKHVAFTESSQATIPPTTSVNVVSGSGGPLMTTGATHSVLTEEIPSCSTSPSIANGNNLLQPVPGRNKQFGMINNEKVSQSTAPMLIPSSLEAVTATARMTKESPKLDSNVKQSIMASKLPNCGTGPQNLVNGAPPTDYLETASSATSVWLSQTDGLLHQGFPMSNFNQEQMFKDAPPETEIQVADPSNNALFGINGDGQLGFPMGPDGFLSNGIDAAKYENHMSTDIDGNYSIPKDAQPEMSSSMVSQSFGASDFDSPINEGAFLNRTSWPPTAPVKRMRTFTKVYKRGAVGRSIDISQFSGYDELKHALARMFSIEGQLEERQRIGWKLVYKDHEDDILLLGDDPWEEFVNCVRCIRILSPQEVQQMSLDGDLGTNILPNQACSSSDGGNAWRARCDQNSGNPSTGSYDHYE
ncbi:hypothetical protein PR202_gb28392 [Eleusine coracana subsp. coracana]|uniref:Auxin-responsive protein n=1 Tax=Eleusine coracana subsp. coracana TaxID=191504 RepID=A0AAV5FU90_ELECO|nr:hypothetical protein PR202_gb28392 [Eleusine coracana subsp. coracana]